MIISGSEKRQLLLRMQTERVCHGYMSALRYGVKDPVIWLVDQDDELGRDLCQRLSDGDSNFLEKCRSLVDADAIAAHIFAAPRPYSVELAYAMSPTGHVMLRTPPPPGYFHLVIVSGGGNSYARLRMP